MSSRGQKHKYFEIDEDGNFKLLPLKIPNPVTRIGKQPIHNKQDSPRRGSVMPEKFVIPNCVTNKEGKPPLNEQHPFRRSSIMPDKFVIPNCVTNKEDSPRCIKKRKINDHVRKELFKQTKTRSHQRMSQANVKIDSPLMSIDEVGDVILKKKTLKNGYLFKSPGKIPKLKFSCAEAEHNTTKQFQVIDSPSSQSSTESEFLELERKCQSPVSSVLCDLMDNAKIRSVKKEPRKPNDLSNNLSNSIKTIKDILHQDQEEFDRYKSIHEKNREAISQILSQLENCNTEKENTSPSRRRSVRLANSNLPVTSKSAVIVSPACQKSVDLRKSTLKKNLSKTIGTNMQSPKMQNAMQMYNSFKADHHFLCTPKADRNLMKLAENESMRSALSRKLKDQCLMLQDTPQHH